MGTHPIFESDFDCLTECKFDFERERKKCQAQEKCLEVDRGQIAEVEDEKDLNHPMTHHEDENVQNLILDQEVVHQEEVAIDLAVAIVAAIDHDLYHQLNIRSSVILGIEKIHQD